MQLATHVRDAFQVDLPLRSLFENPTIAGIADVIIQAQVASADTEMLGEMLAELDELSDAEVQALLVEKPGEYSHD